jgi:hypothetical protein
MEEKEVSGVEEEAPTPTDADQTVENEDAVAEETTEETTEEVVEETPEETEEAPAEERQVPVTVVQRERQRRREALARASEAEAKLAAIEAQKPPEPKPTLDQFETVEQYDAAVRAQEVKDEVARQLQIKNEAEAEEARKLQEAKELSDFTSRIDKARDKFKDFNENFEFVDSVSNQSPGYARALVTSEVVGDIIQHLAANPAEAERIATLSYEGQVKAIGAIEAKIQSPPKPNRTTRAPSPVDPVGGSAKTAQIKWKPGMTPAERAVWKKQAKESGASIAELLG